MSAQPVPPLSDGGPLPAVCAHTHLFRGARVRVGELTDPRAWARVPGPVGLTLLFSDGATAEAELLISGGGEAVLAVSAYVTDAGTPLSRRTWLIREMTAVNDDQAELTIGARME